MFVDFLNFKISRHSYVSDTSRGVSCLCLSQTLAPCFEHLRTGADVDASAEVCKQRLPIRSETSRVDSAKNFSICISKHHTTSAYAGKLYYSLQAVPADCSTTSYPVPHSRVECGTGHRLCHSPLRVGFVTILSCDSRSMIE